MTRAVRDRILKDVNGDISGHLRNHIHLTNCIHLKNHMHKNSPILVDRSLTRDLVVLQRSRSLRDPSASPPSWHSPSIVDLHPKKGERDARIREGRSTGIERWREARRMSGSSPTLPNLSTSKVAPGEVSGGNDGIAAISKRSSKGEVGNGRRIRKEESSRKSNRTDILGAMRSLHSIKMEMSWLMVLFLGTQNLKMERVNKRGSKLEMFNLRLCLSN